MDPQSAPPTDQRSAPPPSESAPLRRQQQHGRGRSDGRGPYQARGHQGRGQQSTQKGRGQGGPVSIAPATGIPYGHVPAYLPGSSSLVEELDQRLLMVLRDGRHLVGVSNGLI